MMMIFFSHFESQASNFLKKYRKYTIPAEKVKGFCIMPFNRCDHVPGKKKYRYLKVLVIFHKLKNKTKQNKQKNKPRTMAIVF